VIRLDQRPISSLNIAKTSMAYTGTHSTEDRGSGTSMLMNTALWVLFGGLAGWLASIFTGDAAGLGIVGNILVGVAGAFVGGFIADKIGSSSADGAERPTSIASFFWAVIGAVVILLLLNLFF